MDDESTDVRDECQAKADSDAAFMGLALELAARAAAEGEVPVGALVVRDGQVLGQGWNRPIELHDPCAHAEIVAMRDAAWGVRNYRLSGCTLYATLEPCLMCAGAIVHARIERVVFGARDPRGGAFGSVADVCQISGLNHRPLAGGGVLEARCRSLLQSFFRDRR